MNCRDCEALLQRRLDGEPADGPALAEHLAACPDCRALHAAAQRLAEGLRLFPAPVPPAGLAERVAARVVRERLRRRRLQRVLALAAALLVGVMGWYGTSRYRRPQTNARVEPPTVAQVPPVVPPVPSLHESVEEASSAVVALTRRAADETVGDTRLLWGDLARLPVADARAVGATIDPPARSLREAGQGVSAGLEPVTTSARRAMNLFLGKLPAGS